MKKTIFHNHFNDGIGTPFSKQLSVQPRSFYFLKVFALDTLDVFLNIQSFSGPFPVNLGNNYIRIIS